MTIPFFIFQKHSMFVPLRLFYPECFVLCEQNNEEHPLACFTHPTIANAAVIEPLVKRVHYVFTVLWPKLMPDVPDERVLYLYYKYPNKPKSLQSGVFFSSMEDPKVIIMNPYAFEKFRKEGLVYSWDAPQDFLLMK